MNRIVLLNPGPVNVTDAVRASLHRGDMCHREPEIARLLGGIRKKLRRAFDIEEDYTAVLITGSGTAALEMATASVLTPGRSMLIVRNGVYGERIGKMAEAYGLPTHYLDTPWGTPPRMEDLDRALTLHPEIEVVALVHHETTTGLLNPLKEVHALCQQHDKRLLLDAVSSLGGEDLDFRETPVDFAAGTANKCLQGYPGVAFVLLKKSHLTRLAALPRRSVYFSLYDNWQAQEAGETLFTPAVQVHYALDQALDELLEETVAGRVRRYRDAARRLREGFRRMGLECLIPEERRSNTLTALRLPPGMTYPWLHDHLRGHGFVIYAGQGPLRQDIFRIANMGDIRPGEFDRLLDVLEKCRTRAGNP